MLHRALPAACSAAFVAALGPALSGPLPVTAAPAAVLAPTTCDVTTYRGDGARSGVMPGPAVDDTGMVGIRWVFDAGRPIASQPLVVGDLAIGTTVTGDLHALDLGTGTERWSATVGSPARGTPLVTGDALVVAATDGLHAIALADGAGRWSQPSVAAVPGATTIAGGSVIAAGADGLVQALDPSTGALRWSVDLGMELTASVAATDRLAVVAGMEGVATALDPADGSLRWRLDTGTGDRIGTPVIAGDRVIVALLDSGTPGTHGLRGLDAATGAVAWTVPAPDGASAYPPAVRDGLAVYGATDGTMHAIDARTSEPRWVAAVAGPVEVVPVIVGDTVVAAANDAEAFALDLHTGAVRWRVPITGVPYGPAVARGVALVGTDDGLLRAISAPGPLDPCGSRQP